MIGPTTQAFVSRYSVYMSVSMFMISSTRWVLFTQLSSWCTAWLRPVGPFELFPAANIVTIVYFSLRFVRDRVFGRRGWL